jgi:hypothetical protein
MLVTNYIRVWQILMNVSIFLYWSYLRHSYIVTSHMCLLRWCWNIYFTANNELLMIPFIMFYDEKCNYDYLYSMVIWLNQNNNARKVPLKTKMCKMLYICILVFHIHDHGSECWNCREANVSINLFSRTKCMVIFLEHHHHLFWKILENDATNLPAYVGVPPLQSKTQKIRLVMLQYCVIFGTKNDVIQYLFLLILLKLLYWFAYKIHCCTTYYISNISGSCIITYGVVF